jgi:hypothetical protein
MGKRCKADAEESGIRSGNDFDKPPEIVQPAENKDDSKTLAKCECPPGCVGLPCCT